MTSSANSLKGGFSGILRQPRLPLRAQRGQTEGQPDGQTDPVRFAEPPQPREQNRNNVSDHRVFAFDLFVPVSFAIRASI